MTLEEKWKSYEQVAVRPDATDRERFETRRAFYAGAMGLAWLIENGGDFSQLCLELDTFTNELGGHLHASGGKA